METERRLAQIEVRAEGRKLTGTVMHFGDVSPSHRERFEPGSLRMADVVHLDLYHDPERAVAWLPDGGLELREENDVLMLAAELPPIPAANRALEEIRTGKTNGLSVEFRAMKETRVNGIRVIHEATLSGVGIVEHPSYAASKVEARRAGKLRWWA